MHRIYTCKVKDFLWPSHTMLHTKKRNLHDHQCLCKDHRMPLGFSIKKIQNLTASNFFLVKNEGKMPWPKSDRKQTVLSPFIVQQLQFTLPQKAAKTVLPSQSFSRGKPLGHSPDRRRWTKRLWCWRRERCSRRSCRPAKSPCGSSSRSRPPVELWWSSKWISPRLQESPHRTPPICLAHESWKVNKWKTFHRRK